MINLNTLTKQQLEDLKTTKGKEIAMIIHKDIQEAGANDFHRDIKLKDNPYQYVSNKLGGVAKEAAWSTGWKKEQSKVNN